MLNETAQDENLELIEKNEAGYRSEEANANNNNKEKEEKEIKNLNEEGCELSKNMYRYSGGLKTPPEIYEKDEKDYDNSNEEENIYANRENEIEKEKILDKLPSKYSKIGSSYVNPATASTEFNDVDFTQINKKIKENNERQNKEEERLLEYNKREIKNGVSRYSDLTSKQFDEVPQLNYFNFSDFSNQSEEKKEVKVFNCNNKDKSSWGCIEQGVLDTAITLGGAISASFMLVSLFTTDVFQQCYTGKNVEEETEIRNHRTIV